EKENVCSFWKKVKPSDGAIEVPSPTGDDDLYDNSDNEEDIDPMGHSGNDSRGQLFESESEGSSEGESNAGESEDESNDGSESESDGEEDEDDRSKGEEKITEKTPAKKHRQSFDGEGRAKRRKKSLRIPAYNIINTLNNGGVEAPPGRYSYMASFMDEDGTHFCGGSLIDESIVITAARCVDWGMNFTLVIGRHNVINTYVGDDATIAGVIPHPKYDIWKSSDYDIALVFLSLPPEGDIVAVSLNADDSVPPQWAPMSLTWVGVR
ncbi:hypothetical protein ACHAWF_017119, partial [Thalassiosira exigua]